MYWAYFLRIDFERSEQLIIFVATIFINSVFSEEVTKFQEVGTDSVSYLSIYKRYFLNV
jgi:hypothetical protein